MQSNTLTISATDNTALRIVNVQHDSLSIHHAQPSCPVRLALDDPRWLFATRVQLTFSDTNRIPSIGQYNDLLETGRGMGFSDMYARTIVGIVETAQLRDGLDSLAMDELADIPSPNINNELSNRGRWITFAVLFSWSLLIAGLMQLV